VLTSLEIKNFRTFAQLRIERLARVNLILGKNNVGKTTLLEALEVYSSRWPARVIKAMLRAREQVVAVSSEKSVLEIESVFHQSPETVESQAVIGPFESGNGQLPKLLLKLAASAAKETKAAEKPSSEEPMTAIEFDSEEYRFRLFADGYIDVVSKSGISLVSLRFDPSAPFLRADTGRPALAETVQRWDDIVLTPMESEVYKATQMFAPIRKIAYVAGPASKIGDQAGFGERIARVLVDGNSTPVPLASLGGGVTRMFQIAVAIPYAASVAKAARGRHLPANIFSPVLIDEIETGIHYTLHADMWRFVLKAAHELGVQVFATTHSWDCVKAFAEAVQDVPECDALAIRLERSDDRSRAISFSPEEMKIVAREEIEVR
jgi:predicted ATP-dependent endonuclease of OLD family